MQYELMEAERI